MAKLKSASPYVLMTLASLPFLFLYAWLIMNSFSKQVSFGLIPEELTLKNWRFLWSPIPWGLARTSIWTVLLNTILYASGVAVLQALVCTLAAYALSRMEFRGKTLILGLQMLLRAFPGVLLLIGTFFVLLHLRLLYTIPGVVLARMSMEIPYGVWIMKGFFDGVPWDIEWAALVDGCSRFQAWRKILFPLVIPGLLAIGLFAFLAGWEDFIFAYILLPGQTQVLSVLIQGLIATEVMDYGLLAAMSLFYVAPAMIFFLLAQRALTKVTIAGVRP
ncbi:MAG: carbohydrate ABC transporter permease [Chloroflexi bacterium]|nr:carbohydrate ABC transporter permease [Chloroflexota bacterium]